MAQGGVERGGLPGAGRAGDEEDAAGPRKEPLERGEVRGLESHVGEPEEDVSPVEQPQHGALAEGRRDGGDADVDLPASEPDLDPPVLGQAALGDVEPRHDLDPGDRRGVPLPGGGDHRVEDAVDTVPDDELLLVRLEVDVAGPLTDRPEQDGVDEADDRRLVGRLEQVPRLLDGGRRVEVPLPRKPLHDLVFRGMRPLVRGVDPGEHLVLRRADDPCGSGEEPHLVDRFPRLRLPARQQDDLPGRGPAGEEQVLAGVPDRDLREKAPLRDELARVGRRRRLGRIGHRRSLGFGSGNVLSTSLIC